MRPERDVDVLVVGSGAAGLSAALSARENGAASVLIAESEGLVRAGDGLRPRAPVVARWLREHL
jgi:succinate dehydrogenase/fumarate reductase flavoprotein subunit